MLYVNAPGGKVCRHRREGVMAKRGGSLTQTAQQTTLVSVATRCITEPSVLEDVKEDSRLWDHTHTQQASILLLIATSASERVRTRFSFISLHNSVS